MLNSQLLLLLRDWVAKICQRISRHVRVRIRIRSSIAATAEHSDPNNVAPHLGTFISCLVLYLPFKKVQKFIS